MHSLFHPRLSSLLPLHIFQVELEKHGVGFQNTRNIQNKPSEIKVLGCGVGILRCRLCSYIPCHQHQPISSPFSSKILSNPIGIDPTSIKSSDCRLILSFHNFHLNMRFSPRPIIVLAMIVMTGLPALPCARVGK